MAGGIESQRFQALQIEILHVVRRGFEHHLELEIALQAVGIFTVAAVRGAARRFHIGHLPGFRAENPQECARIEGAGPALHARRLFNDAAAARPVVLQGKNHVLKVHALSFVMLHFHTAAQMMTSIPLKAEIFVSGTENKLFILFQGVHSSGTRTKCKARPGSQRQKGASHAAEITALPGQSQMILHKAVNGPRAGPAVRRRPVLHRPGGRKFLLHAA